VRLRQTVNEYEWTGTGSPQVVALFLAEALDLVVPYAEAEAPEKFERAAIRWHGRFSPCRPARASG
jgi:hypothetical protein